MLTKMTDHVKEFVLFVTRKKDSFEIYNNVKN